MQSCLALVSFHYQITFEWHAGRVPETIPFASVRLLAVTHRISVNAVLNMDAQLSNVARDMVFGLCLNLPPYIFKQEAMTDETARMRRLVRA